MKGLFSFGLVLLFWLLQPGLGQPHASILNQLTVSHNLTSQNYNVYLFRDSKGFIWISSINGLNRYDGSEVIQYLHETRNSNSLADNHVYSEFFEDHNGDIWFTTLKALHRYNRKNDNFTRFYLPSLLDSRETKFRLFFYDNNSKALWIGNKENLFLLDSLNNQNFRVKKIGDFPLKFQSKIYSVKDSDNLFLLNPGLQGGSIFKFTKTGDYICEIKFPVNPNFEIQVFDYFPISDSVFWLGTNQGLFNWKIDNSYKRGEIKRYELPNKNITKIVSLNEDKLLIITKGKGIYFFDIKKKRFHKEIFIKTDKSFASYSKITEKAFIDADNNLWLGSHAGNGVNFFNLNKQKFGFSCPSPKQLKHESNFIHGLAKDSKNRIISLTRNGIFRNRAIGQDLLSWEKYSDSISINFESENFSIFVDRNDRIWVCGQLGIFMASSFNHSFRKLKLWESELTGGFTFVTQLLSGKLIASSQTNGIFEIKENSSELNSIYLSKIHNFPYKGTFTKIKQDSKGNIFVGHFSKGIYHLKEEDNEIVIKDSLKLFPMPMVNAIVEDSLRGIHWVGTSSGLFKLNLSKDSIELEKETHLGNLDIKGILLHQNSDLWISSNKGLLMYSPEKIQKLTVFKLSDGLQNSEFNHWAYLQLDSLFLFGGPNGVNYFNPQNIRLINTKASPIISKIFVNDKLRDSLQCIETKALNLTEIQHLEFPYNERTLSFTFAPLEYSAPGENTYKFLMEGVDEKPVFSGTNNFTRYPNLPIGTHTLVVDASNSDGIFSGEPTRLKITILPPWYLTKLAILMWILLGMGIIWTIIKIRLNRLKLDKQLAESETAVLRLQMNPHFIFNSLNSIRSYIRLQDIKSADTYLEQFSVLIRKILDSSEKSYSTLYEEKELIEDYIQAESMRFEKSFDFDFFIDSQLDPDDVLLPTMILQPFVENAIWHGLLPKKEKGKIQVNAIKGEEGLIISIQDNGVGREFHKGRTKTHESKGLEITQRRLALLSKKHSYPNSIKIVDLHDPDGNPVGTEVIIRIPLI